MSASADHPTRNARGLVGIPLYEPKNGTAERRTRDIALFHKGDVLNSICLGKTCLFQFLFGEVAKSTTIHETMEA